MTTNVVEDMKASWLGGRGTRVLYASIIVTIIGTLMTGHSMSQARAESEKAAVSVERAVKLANEVTQLCENPDFHLKHTDTCSRATDLLKDPSGGAAGFVVVDAVGLVP